jgi:hypothetical protein
VHVRTPLYLVVFDVIHMTFEVEVVIGTQKSFETLFTVHLFLLDLFTLDSFKLVPFRINIKLLL